MYPNVTIIGLDNMNYYYDTKLKEDRLNILNKYPNFKFIKGDIFNKDLVNNIFDENNPNIVVNLAAQAGVRYSIDHPDTYIDSNIIGFYNILEAIVRSNDTRKDHITKMILKRKPNIVGIYIG